MTVELKWCTFDPMLLKPKCVKEAVDFFNFKKFVHNFQLLVYNFVNKSRLSNAFWIYQQKCTDFALYKIRCKFDLNIWRWMRFLAIKSDRNGLIYSTSLAKFYRCLSHSFESLSLSHTSREKRHISLKDISPQYSELIYVHISSMEKFYKENVSGRNVTGKIVA